MASEPDNTIVFDAVGTLLRPVESISAVYLRHAARFGCQLDQGTVKKRFGEARRRLFHNQPHQPSSDSIEKQCWRTLVESVFHELPVHDQLFDELWSYYSNPESWVLFPEVTQCLEELEHRGWKFAIASNFDSRLIAICQNIPPLDKLVNVFCSGLIGFRKPDIRFFRSVERRLGWPENNHDTSTNLLMVGDDAEKDIKGACAAGWQALHVDRSDFDASLLELGWPSIRLGPRISTAPVQYRLLFAANPHKSCLHVLLEIRLNRTPISDRLLGNPRFPNSQPPCKRKRKRFLTMPSTSFIQRQSEHKVRARTHSTGTVATDVQVECLSCLDQSLLQKWHEFQSSNPALDNGCFHPEFSKAVERVRDDVEYAIVRRDGEVTGLFPFQRVGSRIGKPVGGLMNDFHGLISNPGARLNFSEILKQAGLKRFDFHALSIEASNTKPGDPPARSRRVYRELDCPFVDLGGVHPESGNPTYHDWLMNHSSTIRRQPQKTRRMARELGPVRMEIDCLDPAMLEKVIEWKRDRFKRTHTFDLLGLQWTSDFLREIFKTRTEGFQGQLSVLWAGDTPVAGHMGFRSKHVLHYYVPAHNNLFGRYSPGTELMYQLTSAAPEHDIQRIDFGYGPSDLKDRFANGQSRVQCGCISFSPLSRLINHGRFEARQVLKRIPLKEPLKRIVRPLHPNLGKGNFR